MWMNWAEIFALNVIINKWVMYMKSIYVSENLT